MTAAELLTAMEAVTAALAEMGVVHFVGGSLASSVHGLPRASIDGDLVADLRPEHARPLTSRLEAAFYVDHDRVLDAIRRRWSLQRHPPGHLVQDRRVRRRGDPSMPRPSDARNASGCFRATTGSTP